MKLTHHRPDCSTLGSGMPMVTRRITMPAPMALAVRTPTEIRSWIRIRFLWMESCVDPRRMDP